MNPNIASTVAEHNKHFVVGENGCFEAAEPWVDRRLVVIGSKRLWLDAEGLKAMGGYGIEIETMARHFREVLLCQPLRIEDSIIPGYIIRAPNVSVYGLPDSGTLGNNYARLRFFGLVVPQIVPRLFSCLQPGDVVQARLSGYVGMIGLAVARMVHCPIFVYIATDWRSRILATKRTRFRALVGRGLEILIRQLVRGLPVVVVPGVPRFSPTQNVVFPTTLTASDIMSPNAICTRPGSPARVLWVGRLAQEKGLVYLLEAIAMLRSEGVKVTLDLIGSGALEPELRTVVESLGLADVVQFSGYVPLGESLYAAYRTADVFVLPSLSEGLPKVILEAQASGAVVVATQVGGIPQVVRDQETGLLVPPADAQALAAAIRRALEDEELRYQLILGGLRTVAEHTLEKEIARMVQAVRDELV